MNNQQNTDPIKLPARIRKLLLEDKAVEMRCIVPAYAKEMYSSVENYLIRAVGFPLGSRYEILHEISTREQLVSTCKDCTVATDIMFVRRRSIDEIFQAKKPANPVATPVKLEHPKPSDSFTAAYQTMDPQWTQREAEAVKALRYLESARKRVENQEHEPIGPASMIHIPRDTHRRAKIKAISLGITISRYATILFEKDLNNKE